MSEQQPTTQDQSGIERTPTGDIVDQTTKPDSTTSQTEKTPETPPEIKDDKSLLTKDDKAPTGAPEKYEAFTVPEGFVLDEKVNETATGLFKELNLDQASGQKLVDFYVKHVQEAVNAPIKLWQDQQQAWRDEVKSAPDLGPKFDSTIKPTIAKALDSLPAKIAEDFREAMDYTGAGNNPAFIRAMYNFAQRLTEGSHVTGTKPSPHGQRSPEQPGGIGAAAMYPKLPSASGG